MAELVGGIRLQLIKTNPVKRFGSLQYRPRLPNSQGAIVVVHDVSGVDNQLAGVAERYARVGYVTLAADLYRGAVAMTPDEAQSLVEQLSPARVESDLRAAVRWLRTQTFVKRDAIGAIGMGLGGGFAMLLATGDENAQAVISLYGHTGLLMARIADVRAPMLGVYGALDTTIPVAQVHALRDALTAVGKPNEFVVHPHASHAFFNEQQPSFRFDEAEDGWSRSNKFFYRYLGEPQRSR